MPIFTGKTSANTHEKMQVTSAVVSRYPKYKQNQNFYNIFFLVRLQRTTFVSKPTLRNDKKCKIKTSHIWKDLSKNFTLTKLFQMSS